MIHFNLIKYSDLNAKQKEIFNFQKASALLAEYGYATYRLTDDWNGADFLAIHFNGSGLLHVQLKGRLTFEKKYLDKNLWVCFRYEDFVYLYPHDIMLNETLKITNIKNTASWTEKGIYSFPTPPKSLVELLKKYCLSKENHSNQ